MPKKGLLPHRLREPGCYKQNSVNRWPNRTENNIFMVLDRQYTCTFIMLPYNFKWVFLLYFHPFNLIISISNIWYVYMYQQFSLDLAQYRDWSSLSCGVRRKENANNTIPKLHGHHPERMSSLHKKVHRSRRHAVWSLYQDWLSGMNTIRTPSVILLNIMNSL
jgi:hypothetical protein